MRVILSRKGFDSEFGGGPSPILPDGRMVSLPIPSESDPVRYEQLRLDDGRSYAGLMAGLGYGGGTCHLDPDLVPGVRDRHPDWRPLFGQVEAAQGHLRNQGVGPGDLFLFFGYFRRTLAGGGWDRTDPGRHVIFGYLEVESVLPVGPETELPPWMADHPHALSVRRARRNNVIYVGRRTASWNPALPGAGPLRFDEGLVLTAPSQTRSRWRLPDCLRTVSITYHTAASWKEGYFQSAAKAQEFVIDPSPAVSDWARSLVETGASSR
ncbi:MAG TPA: hypothetical protein VNT75_30610 [Symbiobacteriaceae bacterium]|nr:hypothetical protein [Symbiobacteriaceae bacterium]